MDDSLPAPLDKMFDNFREVSVILGNFGNFKLYYKAKIMISFGDRCRGNVTTKKTNLQMHAFSPSKQLGFYFYFTFYRFHQSFQTVLKISQNESKITLIVWKC